MKAFLSSFVLIHLLLPVISIAEVDEPQIPFCTGLANAEYGIGILELSAFTPEAFCPDGYAFFSHMPARSYSERNGDPARVTIGGNCCPLPKGSLTHQHTFVAARCPENYVVTGGRIAPKQVAANPDEHSTRYELRCTKLYTKQYRLSPPVQSLEIKNTESFDSFLRRFLFNQYQLRTSRSRIPPSHRWAFGRRSTTRWEDSCISYPWGGILTGIGSSGCSDFRFQALLPADSSAESIPLQSCKVVEKPFSAAPRCVE